ncbi:MAG: hypothetical protein QOF78_2633 [Phycisphaerales bacterium]|jgi:ABC-type transport system involved in multi-copper enzyme maturation permease subunit|nr:hypothetical protein [Phycisphaerales bacterium]
MLHTLAIPDFITQYLGRILFVLVVVAGLIFGASDLARFRWRRVWAISQVVWIEAWRRKIWLVTPLAFLGVVIISQLQKPYDEQDAIRQTIKFCIFATGLVVAMTTIILACTNLPREIENRVIYTIATKPTTRLEIVLGKVVGFAKVSLTILFIMGTLAWAYLALREANMRRFIAERLNTEGAVAPASVATLKYYQEAGLLYAKRQEEPDAMQILARPPEESGMLRYFYGNGEGSFLMPFDINPSAITPPGASQPAPQGLVVVAHVGYLKKGAATQPSTTQPAAPAPATTQVAATGPAIVPYYGPFIIPPEQRQAMMTGSTSISATEPTISIDVLDANHESLGAAKPFPPLKILELTNRNGLSQVSAYFPPEVTALLKGRVYIRVFGQSPDTEYFVDMQQTPDPVRLLYEDAPQHYIPLAPAPSPVNPKLPAAPIFQTRSGTFGQQLRGGPERTPVAIYRFRAAEVRPTDGKAPFEFRAGIERSGADAPDAPGFAGPTEVLVRVRNRATSVVAETIVRPESNRTLFFTVPADAVQGGEFDVHLKNLTLGDYVGLGPRSVVLITETQSFAWNLTKSMLILWLMSILITTIAIFTSTFLSWPIAVVLTMVILLGHWGVQQLGESIQPGIGATVVTDFQLKDPAKARAVQETVEKLSSFLNFISTILPDISKYAAVEDIERGVSIPWLKLRDALAVTLGFGLPLVLLSYIFLKNKEVAP